jgi:hypothetical protein
MTAKYFLSASEVIVQHEREAFLTLFKHQWYSSPAASKHE